MIRKLVLLAFAAFVACSPPSSKLDQSQIGFSGPPAGFTKWSASKSQQRLLVAIDGQSNAFGHAEIKDGSAATQLLAAPYTNVRLAQKLARSTSNSWDTFTTGPLAPRATYLAGDNVTGNMGIELSFGRSMDAWASRFDLAKVAVGSSSLAADWPGAFQTNTTPALFLQEVQFLRDTERELGASLAAYVWIQAEQDATNATWAANYQTNLTNRITFLRTYWPNLPIVIVRLSSGMTGLANLATIRAAQAAVVAAVSNTALVNTDDLTLQADNLHYTADSYVTLGQRCAAAVQSLTLIAASTPGATLYQKDATSGKAKPLGAWEWGRLLLAANITAKASPAPTYHWRAQDLTTAHGGDGNVHDSIANLTWTTGGAPTLESSVSGWSTKGIAFTGTTDALSLTAGSAWNVATQSVFRILRLQCSHPAAEKALFYLSATAPLMAVNETADGKLKVYSNGVTTASVSDHGTGAPILIGWRYNKTAGTNTILTSLEKLSVPYAVGVDGNKGIGAAFGFGPNPTCIVLDDIAFTGSDAEVSDAQVKSLYQTMGETITWN